MIAQIEECLTAYAHGEVSALKGLIDWLIYEKKISLERVCFVAWTRWQIPREVVIQTIMEVM